MRFSISDYGRFTGEWKGFAKNFNHKYFISGMEAYLRGLSSNNKNLGFKQRNRREIRLKLWQTFEDCQRKYHLLPLL